MSDDERANDALHDLERPRKRFRHESYKSAISQVHVPSATNKTTLDDELDDSSSTHLAAALARAQQLNLSPAFVRFHAAVYNFCGSVPLMLLHLDDIVRLWSECVAISATGDSDADKEREDNGLAVLLEFLPAILTDLRASLVPHFVALLTALTSQLNRPHLSPRALTATLSGLGALVRTVVPSTVDSQAIDDAHDRLARTHSTILAALSRPNVPPEIQASTAEVWGSVLRRLKGELREQAVNISVQSLGSDTPIHESFAAYALVMACKTVNSSLHSAAASLVSLFLAHLFDASDDIVQRLLVLLRRVLTALTHHCAQASAEDTAINKPASGFAPLATMLANRLAEALPDRQAALKYLGVAGMVLAVRGGSRWTKSQVAELVRHAVSIAISANSEADRQVVLRFALAALAAGDMTTWSNVGRSIINWAWNDATLALELSGSIACTGWAGWKLVGLPPIISRLPPLLVLDTPPNDVVVLALRTLAALATTTPNMAPPLDNVTFWNQVNACVNKMLDSNEIELLAILTLAPFLANLTPRLICLVDEMLISGADAMDLSALLDALARTRWESRETDVLRWARKLLAPDAKWAAEEWVMVAFDKLVKACDQRGIQDGAKEILLDPTGLHGALRSHKRGLRLSALQLLVGPLFLSSDTSVLEHILSAEECTLDVAGVRGRTVRITKLPALLDAGSDGSIGFAVGWLTAQLKVNLRPIWDPTVKALSAVSQRWPEAVWGHLWGDLERLTENSGSITTEDRTSDDEHAERDQDALTEPTRESERTWRDPSLFAIDGLVRRWNSNGAWERQQVREAHTSRDRLDVANYEAQLLKALSEMPSLAEKHSRAFIPRFLVLVPSEGLSPEEDGIGRHKKPSHRITAYGARPCLSGWLTLLGKFVNPKAAFRSTELKDAYIALLAHPDRSLQDGALTALATYKDATLTRLEPRFRALLDETRWRDEAAALASQLPSTATDRLVLDSIAEHVLVRLSWGLMTERRAGAQKRAALLSMLGASGNNAVQALCDLMCAFAGSAATPGGLEAAGDAMEHHDLMVDLSAMPALVASEKQQMGFLVMLGDVLQTLGTHTVPSWDRLVWCTILCMHWAQRRIDSGSKAAFRGEHDKETADDENLEVEAPAESTQRDGESVVVATGATRAIRQTGFKRLVEFFRAPVLPSTFDFTPFLRFAFASFISPRLALFDRENTQASSALLQVFSAWASGTGEIGDELTPHTVFWLVNFDDRVLPKIFDLLSANGVTPKVVVKVLDIADRILELAAEDGEVAARVFIPHVNTLLHNLSALVAKASRAGTVNELAGRQITILSKTAKHVHDPQQAATLLSLVDLLLRRPARVVAEKVKADLLRVYGDLVPLVPALQDPENEMFGKTFDLFVGLFSALRTRAARVAAADALKALSSPNERLVRIADLVSDLNAFSTKRVEQYDFNRRLDAFRAINEVIWSDATPREWLPLLQNALYFIQDPEELSLRQNSAYTLRRFVERLSADGTIDWMASQLMQTFSRVVWPALKRGLRASTELVRSEVLGVIAFGIERCDKIPVLVEMRPLLADGDEEASFFANICHIQVHRRTRAIRRLAEYVQSGILSNAVLSQVFLPLLAHPIFTSGTTNHLLVNEAITTTGVVARHLTWGSYNGLVLQYQRAIKSPKEKDKVPIKPLVRTLVSILDNFHFPMDAALEKDAGYGHEDTDEEQEQADPAALKGDTRIMDAVVSKLLPALLHILETRDETEDALRIPVCVGIVRIALHLPAPQRTPQVSRLLTIIAQIFRSKSQDTRDLARETLCRVVVMLGPDSLQETMHQLRAALTRGPHLHILAYVAHSLLVHVTTHTDAADAFANLDNSVADIVHVAAEVVFGESGKDVQSEGFTTKLKEVKGSASRGLDTFSLAAKGISPAKLTALLLPIRKITEETESAKVMALVDDVLRRIASGLNANARLSAGDLLLVCHTLVSQNAKFLKQTQTPTAKKAKLHPDVEVSLKRTAEQARDHYGNNSHRFIALGLDVFVTAARRSRFDFQNEDTISRLEPMVPAIGNTLYSSQSGVLVVALKAAAAITKCPLKNVDRSLSVLLRQILDVIKQTGSTDSEVTQTALKTLAMVLRDKPASQVKEKDLTYLLELVGPDLEEHERQASVFAILRAIISRKFIVPEIYDIMDRVAVVMVTSQSPQVQELCRGVLLQFFLDYPQGKGRLQKQMNFLAKNLSYVYESGRKSAMELLRVILTKFDPALMDEFSNLFFVALVMVMSNDESTTCREMASELVKTLFQIMNEPKRIEIISMLQTWATQADKIQLSRVSIQILGVVADTLKDDATPFLPSVLSLLGALIAQQAALLQEAELDSMGHAHLEWQLPYQALTVLGKVLQGFPARALSSEVPWQAIISLLLFPHAWVRTGAARLLGSLFASQQPTQPNKRLPAEHPLSPSSLTETARKTCLQLSGDTLDSQLAVQVTKNLVYLGKCFAISASATTEHGMGQEDGSDETSDDDVEAQPTSQVPPPAGQLNWLFSRLSHQSRAAIVARRNRKTQADHWTEQPSSILKFFAAMSIYMDAALTTKFLVHMLAPVQRILDEDTIDDEPFDALKTLAAEVQDLVLKKVGTTAFTEVFSKLRNRSINVKRERKEARALMVATDPQRAAARKKQHDAVKKESKKRKNRDFREGRTGKIPVTKKQRLE